MMDKEKKSVDEIISKMKPWVREVSLLREIVLSTGLEETIKWGGPTYVSDGKNVLGIGAFKNYATIWFYHGVFLSDPKKVLVNAQEGTTKGLRQWRFTSMEEIHPALVTMYVKEAIKLLKEGKEIKPQRKKTQPLPVEFEAAFNKDKKLKACFDNLSPGKQGEYIDHVALAKGEETRLRRVQKSIPIILSGKGLNDRYK